MKTAALISFACQAGALIANASKELTEKLATFGTYLGLAFQLTDDLLDFTTSSEVLGKTAGKDESAQKATFVRLYGIEETQKNEMNSLLKQKHFYSLLVPKQNHSYTLPILVQHVKINASINPHTYHKQNIRVITGKNENPPAIEYIKLFLFQFIELIFSSLPKACMNIIIQNCFKLFSNVITAQNFYLFSFDKNRCCWTLTHPG